MGSPKKTEPYKILPSQGEHAAFLIQQIEKKKINKLQLASFGLWAGINNDGSASMFSLDNPVAKVLDLVQEMKIQMEIVIGIPPFSSRAGFKQPACIYYADSHRRMLQRVFQSRKMWPNILWFYHRGSHTKLAIGWKNDTPLWAVTGGHNLGDSNLADFSVVLENAGPTFAPIFESLKADSDPDISEIRVNFEESVKDAQAPGIPAVDKTPDGASAGKGIFQSSQGPSPVPERKLPPAEDLVDFLLALAKRDFLVKERFTQLARSCAWLINQDTGKLRSAGEKAFGDNQAIQEALRAFRDHKGL